MKFSKAKTTLVWTETLLSSFCLQTSHAVTFMLHELAKYPKVQEKLHQEVVSVLGRKGLPSDKDMQSLPYVTACMRETLRYGTSTTNVFALALFSGFAQLSILIFPWKGLHDNKAMSTHFKVYENYRIQIV